MQERQIPREEIVEAALVHLPLYTFKYVYDGATYTALVDGATSQTLANLYPAKAEAPYQAVTGLAAVVFLFLATFPVVGALVDGSSGMGVGLLLCTALGVPAALALFALAYWVAAKV